MAAPSYSASVQAAHAGNTTPTVTLPADIAPDTLAIMTLTADYGGNANTLTPPAGWSCVPYTDVAAGQGMYGNSVSTRYSQSWFYYKFLGPDDSETVVSMTLANSDPWAIDISLFEGVNVDVPFGGVQYRSAYSNTYSFDGIYNGFGDALGVNIVSGKSLVDWSTFTLGGTTTNWSKRVGYDGGNSMGMVLATNSASHGSASSSAQATGLTMATGLDHWLNGVSLSLNSADTDFTEPRVSAGIEANGLNASTGGGGTRYLISGFGPYHSDNWVVPGMVMLCSGQSTGYGLVTGAVVSGNPVTEHALDDTGASRHCFLVSKQLTAADLSHQQLSRFVGDFGSGTHGACVLALLACAGDAAVEQFKFRKETGSTDTPDPASLDAPVGESSAMLVYALGTTSGSDPTALTGYTFPAAWVRANTVDGTTKVSAMYKLGPLTPATDDDPPAGSGWDADTWSTYVAEVSGGTSAASGGGGGGGGAGAGPGRGLVMPAVF